MKADNRSAEDECKKQKRMRICAASMKKHQVGIAEITAISCGRLGGWEAELQMSALPQRKSCVQLRLFWRTPRWFEDACLDETVGVLKELS